MAQPKFETVQQARAMAEDDLIQRRDVLAVAVGLRQTQGEQTDEPCVKAFVPRKVPLEQLPPERVLPRHVAAPDRSKVPVDVEEMAPPWSPPYSTGQELRSVVPYFGMSEFELRQRMRPALGGASVSHYLFQVGTITTAVRDKKYPGVYFILSNNHVLARLNGANPGDPILQPAPEDGGTYPQSLIGRLSRYVPLRFDAGSSNLVDAAIAYTPTGAVLPQVCWIGALHALRSIQGVKVGELVQKVGRTTGLTYGTIVAINASIKINYALAGFGNRVALFRQQILTNHMAGYGDSGSALLDMEGNAIGLLGAGSTTHTVFNYLENVQNELAVVVADKMI